MLLVRSHGDVCGVELTFGVYVLIEERIHAAAGGVQARTERGVI